MTVSRLTDAGLAAMPHVVHGFFTRRGGVSEGVYSSLNCGLGSGDMPAAVRANRSRAMAALGHGEMALVTSYQVHGTDVREIDAPPAPDPARPPPRADAMVTMRPGVALGVLTADCAPVLLADAEAGVVGAAHAGWRGALAGVAEAAVEAMERHGARRARVIAAIGPCIGPKSYEVGPEFPAPFLAHDAAAAGFFSEPGENGRPFFDLAGYVAWRLAHFGVATATLGHDTCADADAFFSYRRACHKGERDYGRLLSAIALAP